MKLELISFFTRRKIIYLQDFDGEVYKTIENKKTLFGDKTAYVYPFTKTACVILNNDGTVSNSYIKKWRYK